jgi:hypothetical protein
MHYITIADLKKQAKKARKNNNSIKNHAESLNVVAQQNNFNNWADLIDNALLIKNNTLTDAQQLSLLKEFVNETTTTINEFNLIFKTTNYEMLSIFVNKYFLYESIIKTEDENLWSDRAKKWMDSVCFVFLNSDLPRNINGFRKCLTFKTMLEIIDEKNLYDDENVEFLFDMTGHVPQKGIINEPTNEVRDQNSYCALQYTAIIGFIADSLAKFFDGEFSIKKVKIKELILKNYLWFMYDYNKSTSPILDKNKLLTRYKNSFKTEIDFLEALKKHLNSI